MKGAWSGIVFSLGLFALAAQTLLFRSFLTVFEGSELGIGCFFGSWLLWVALGALLARMSQRARPRSAFAFALQAALYLPAFLLQEHLIAGARAVAGIGAYELFPLARMAAVSLLVNAPVSLLTGWLFTGACSGAAAKAELPVARVYVLESLGSVAGGVLATLLLAFGLPAQSVFLWIALVLLIPLAAALRRRAAWLAPLAVLALIAAGAGGRWAAAADRAAWARLLPADDFRGAFATAQGKYLHGIHDKQFEVLSWGAVCETLPAKEQASEVVAASLAEHPATRRVLVVGTGALGICRRFFDLPQIERVVWLHPDPDYPRALLRALPEALRAGRRPEIPGLEVREYLTRHQKAFDLVLLALPDVTTLARNRYATREFFALVRDALVPDGVLGLRFSGGENFLGGELAYLGSSAHLTLSKLFKHLALEPGEKSWWFASNRPGPTSEPAVLRDRFAALQGAAAVYPPDGLVALFPPDRVAMQLEAYHRARETAGRAILENRDAKPKALLFGLAVALRRAGRSQVAGDVAAMLKALVWIVAAAIALAAGLRLAYLLLAPRSAPDFSRGLCDTLFLVAATGCAGMSSSVVLLFLFQARYGSLFLLAGLAFALYMLGLFCGAAGLQRFLGRRAAEPRLLLPALLAVHLGVFALVAALAPDGSRGGFVILFFLSGAAAGTYFPLAAFRLRVMGREPARAGALLETADHLGGALGATGTGLLLLPLLGAQTTLLLLALGLAAQALPLLVAQKKVVRAAPAEPFARRVRIAGYALLGFAALALIASQRLAQARAGRREHQLEAAARGMAGQGRIVERTATLPGGASIRYFELAQSGDRVFDSSELAGEVSGYGGPIAMAVRVGPRGILRDLRILHSRETPIYLERIEAWRRGLIGTNIFRPDAFEGVDTVSGATISSRAILQSLRLAGGRFASGVLGLSGAAPAAGRSNGGPDRDFLVLAGLFAAALALRAFPRRWLRLGFLLAVVLLAGFALNLQYSTQQVFALLGLQAPPARLGAGIFLLLCVPAVVVLFGNVYCGYLCPFGALQELVGELRPSRVATDPSRGVWRLGRTVKYALLAITALAFAWTRDGRVLRADPLITFFGPARGGLVLALALGVLVLALFYRRFWCRTLCPAGAFLALLNRIQLLRRFLPRLRIGRCDLGVASVCDLDCLCCDRCRR